MASSYRRTCKQSSADSTYEAYTSKTVSWTGEVKQIGYAKCIPSGSGKNKVVVDRDYNGARNIMLRALRASSLKIV